jgi:hypothetical protein
MKSKIIWIPAVLVLLGFLLVQCGEDKAGEGDFCEKDSQCKDGLVCRNNICLKPDPNECYPPCPEGQICDHGECKTTGNPDDKDGDGWLDEDDCNDLNREIHPGAIEYCDGIDNDCDMLTDEDCAPCSDGTTVNCGTDLGECTPGTQTCTGGTWEVCSGVGPQIEACDGKDNDCNGLIDDKVCPCSAGDQYPCGVNEGICTEGVQNCNTEGFFTECTGQLPQDEICDDLDNDCDGQTDEDLETDPGPNTCALATDLGNLPDSPYSVQTVTGKVWPAGDEDWFMITGVDDPVEDQLDSCDSFHFKVVFSHNPGDGLLIDVYSEGCDAANLDCGGDVEYEHTYDFQEDVGGQITGQCPCSTTSVEGINDCTAEDKVFYIRVYGLSGAESCEEYELTISNGTPP